MIVEAFLAKHAEELELELVSGEKGLSRAIEVPEIERPGLCLMGYLKDFSKKSILVFGKSEIQFLKELPPLKRTQSLKKICSLKTPLIILSQRLLPLQEMVRLCDEKGIP